MGIPARAFIVRVFALLKDPALAINDAVTKVLAEGKS